MDFSSMRPSSWNGVGAMAKVPAALWVSFVIGASVLIRSFRSRPNPNSRVWGSAPPLPEGEVKLKPSRAHLDFFLGEENLLRMFNHILRLPSRVRRLPARLFHHPHLAHTARAGDAEDLAGLVPREIADHV